MRSSGWLPRTMLAVGLTFLYAPILSMMVFSLNNSRLVTVWGRRPLADPQVVRRTAGQR